MRAIIFANGTFDYPKQARALIRPDDFVIAADGGTRHALSIDLVPQVVIGDLDSIPPIVRARVEDAGARIISHPPRKDETDLELALHHAAQIGAKEIIILGALGGRLDQLLANVMLLTMPALMTIEARIVDGPQTAFLIRDEATIAGQPGDTVSFLPLGRDVQGVTATGLEWELHNETLQAGAARGISNVLKEPQAHVSLWQGLLLCIITRKRVEKEKKNE